MKSKEMRANPLFMRNTFPTVGKWGMPIIKKQELPTSDIQLLSSADARSNDSAKNKNKGVHFFVDDYRFTGIYNNPKRSLRKYSQYKFLLTPDFSTYAEMNLWRQMESIAHSRWVGAYWQSKGLTVIPTVSWSTPRSFEFCFDGIEKGSVVAVGTLGCKKSKRNFMRGYNEMLERIEPSKIIVFDKPFDEMTGDIIYVDYLSSRKEAN